MRRKQPIFLSCSPEGLLIDCLFTYNRRAFLPLQKENLQGRPVSDLIEEGIAGNWSGSFEMTAPLREALSSFCQKTGDPDFFSRSDCLSVQVRISRYEKGWLPPSLASMKNYLSGRRRPARIYVRKSLILPAHAASPLHRRLWGILKTGQLESMGFNWSLMHPGYMTIPLDTPPHRLLQVAAHEAGHLLGLGDAYAAWYRFFRAAPDTRGFMMRDNSNVQSLEVAMVLGAHTSGRMQYFPRFLRTGGKGNKQPL